MGIDAIKGYTKIQQAMVSVDDGTADGHVGTNPFSAVPYAAIATPDGMRGDGRHSMRDLRVWRDAYLQTRTTGVLTDSDLDGGALHCKKDLNFDGVIGLTKVDPSHTTFTWTDLTSIANTPPTENAWPRCDFNGDGLVNLASLTVNGQPRSDLELLVDAEFWTADEVDGYREGVYADPGKEGQPMPATPGDRGMPWPTAWRTGWLDLRWQRCGLPDSCDLHMRSTLMQWRMRPAGCRSLWHELPTEE